MTNDRIYNYNLLELRSFSSSGAFSPVGIDFGLQACKVHHRAWMKGVKQPSFWSRRKAPLGFHSGGRNRPAGHLRWWTRNPLWWRSKSPHGGERPQYEGNICAQLLNLQDGGKSPLSEAITSAWRCEVLRKWYTMEAIWTRPSNPEEFGNSSDFESWWVVVNPATMIFATSLTFSSSTQFFQTRGEKLVPEKGWGTTQRWPFLGHNWGGRSYVIVHVWEEWREEKVRRHNAVEVPRMSLNPLPREPPTLCKGCKMLQKSIKVSQRPQGRRRSAFQKAD